MNYEKLKKLEKALRGVETPDKGFHTRAQWSLIWKISEQHTNRELKKFVENNLMTVKSFRIKCGQVVRYVPHYKIS